MSTIINAIKEEKNQKFVRVQAKVSEDMKNKIEHICEENGVNIAEYLGKILEHSEINKVFVELEKKAKKRAQNEAKEEAEFNHNVTQKESHYEMNQ